MTLPAETASSGLLDIPKHYGLKVDDIIHFDRDGRASSKDELDGGADLCGTGAGAVLVTKICDALSHQGYDDETIQKVGSLVIRNLMTCDSAQVGEEAGLETSFDDEGSKGEQRTVELMLKGLLDKAAHRSRTVNMNSNEPILMLNGFDQIDRIRFSRVVDEVMQQLQQDWNIWPVRVYAGQYLPNHGTGFSITLLNVVNTDIGGPSMVQLLDEHTDATEWHSFVRWEVWRARDLVFRETREWKSEERAEDVSDDGSEHSFESDSADSTESALHHEMSHSPLRAESPEAVEEEPASEESPAPPNRQEQHDSELEGDTVEYEKAAFVEPEDEQTTSVPEDLVVPERKISYPTWDRRHDSTSLIDLIRSQALEIPPLGNSDEKRVESLDEAAEEPLPSEPEQKDDDSFVVL